MLPEDVRVNVIAEIASNGGMDGIDVLTELKKKTDKTCSEAESFLAATLQTVPELTPLDTATFGGAIIKSKLSWPFRLMGEQGGDYRDWESIKSWGHEVAKKLTTE